MKNFENLELSRLFKINPYSTISSGSLLISINEKRSKDLINLLRKNGINSAIIGEFTSDKNEYLLIDENQKKSRMSYTEVDEITKIF